VTHGSKLQRRIQDGKFVVTAEVTPPLSTNSADLLSKVAPLKGRADAVNVTDAPGARAAMGSLAAAAILVNDGIDAVLQMTCRDRNRIALVGDLLGAAAQGVRNVLVLHGDDPAGGDQPDAKPVYDLDSKGIMQLMRQMRDEGTLPSEREIISPPPFFIGAADAPHDPEPDWQPTGLLAKIEAGADFAQTQFCFDVELVRRYLARLTDHGIPERLKILIGIGPIASARSARWMNENLFGVTVPDDVIDRLKKAADQKAEGQRICTELIQSLREVPGVAGVHIMSPNQSMDVIAKSIDDAGLR
jgi:methylenetetrahydrofolate reductase (NADPH)